MGKPRRKVALSSPPPLELVPDRPAYIPPQPLKPLTNGQRLLLSSLRANTLTVVRGPAGTGKTYVTLAYAATLLQKHEVERLIITRPLVGVDNEESLIGALPGMLEDKIAPWAFPMTDILVERLGKSFYEYLIKTDRIRVTPMAYLRGSSFNNSFIFCTEAQNTSPKQIKMLLTRVGQDAKVCLDGDQMQSDIKGPNGLQDAIHRLIDLPHVGIVNFTRADVVRSEFCQSVLARYED